MLITDEKLQKSEDMREVVIASACRTPTGTFGGSLKNISAIELGCVVTAEAIKRAGVSPEDVDELIFGNVLSAGLGQNPARQIAIHSGIPQETPSYTVNKLCSSGLKAVQLAVQEIKAGDADIIVAGGTENMSRAPHLIEGYRWGKKWGNATIEDSLIVDGLKDVFTNTHMGMTAENIVSRCGISREEQDEFALSSQMKAEAAIRQGLFRDEIIPVRISDKNGEREFDTDEHPRFGTKIESLAKLKPAFKKDGSVTAGNSSGINDGAAALVIMSKDKAEAMGISPLASVISCASAGVDPAVMGLGPIEAVKEVVNKTGIAVDDIDMIELNEAFAAQSIAVNNAIGWDTKKVNISGGAIALGHPIGCSGARILVTLLYGMKRMNKRLGIAALCIGGGMGMAMLVKMK